METSTSMLRIVALSVLPGLVLIIQNGVRLKTSSEMLHDKTVLKDNVLFTIEVDTVIHQTQLERGLTSLYVTSDAMNSSEDALKSVDDLIQKAQKSTDEALEQLSRWTHTASLDGFESKRDYIKLLNELRNQTQDLNVEAVVRKYSSFIAVFIDWMVGVFEHKSSDVWSELVAYHMLVNGKESVGIERSIGTTFFTTGKLSHDTLLWYKGRHELSDSFIRQFGVYSDFADELNARHLNVKIKDDVNFMRDLILHNRSVDFSVHVGMNWVNNMTEYIDELDQVIRAMADFLTKKTEEEMTDYELELVGDIIIVLLTVIIVPLLAFFVYRIAQKMEEIRKNLQEKTINLETEQQRTETLLSQLIPAKIAKRMHKNAVDPEYYECVTVMYSDICDFTMFVNKSTPGELVSLVNDIFDVFEKRIAVHNVTKIGCLGNVLMVGSGLHQRHTNRHVVHVANLAIDLLERVHHITVSHMYGEKVKLKIGINTGPVVSGIVEGTFPRYCIFGQTTAEAERMMATSLPQRIQITEKTRRDLETHKEFIVRERDDLNRQSLREPERHTYWLIENTCSAVQLDVGLLESMEV